MDSGHLLVEGHGQNPNRFTGITAPDWSPGRRSSFEVLAMQWPKHKPAPGTPGAGFFLVLALTGDARRGCALVEQLLQARLVEYLDAE
jgi:hypothetical protein